MTRAQQVSVATGVLAALGAVTATAHAQGGAPTPIRITRTSAPTVVVTGRSTVARFTGSSAGVRAALDRAAALRDEAERRSYTAPTYPVARGYADAASGASRALSLLGQYGRDTAEAAAPPTSRTEAQQDVNAIWGAASSAGSPTTAGRLKRAAYLYAQAAGRFFAAEAREGRPAATAQTAPADGATTPPADGTVAAAPGNVPVAPVPGYGYYSPYLPAPILVSPNGGYGGYGGGILLPGGFYGGGAIITGAPGQTIIF